jgi:DNA-binding beta-propeller fold protein YncE
MRYVIAFVIAAVASAQSPFRLEKTIPLPGVDGRIDHLTIDVHGKRLFLSALGNNTTEVVDVGGGKPLQSLPDMNEPQGASFVPGVGKLYVANGKSGKLRIFGGSPLKSAGEVDFGEDADNVRFDAAHNLIWVGYQDGTLASMDVASNKRLTNIYIDGHPESFQLEKGGTRIFANVPDAREIEVVDRKQGTILAKWVVPGAEKNFPMALDEANHRIFVGCRKPAKVLVMDMETGKVVAEFDCPGDSDDLFFDPVRKRLYVAGGEGFIEAFEQKGANEYHSLGKIQTAAGARTALFVPDLNRMYLAVPHKGNQGAEVRVYTVD